MVIRGARPLCLTDLIRPHRAGPLLQICTTVHQLDVAKGRVPSTVAVGMTYSDGREDVSNHADG